MIAANLTASFHEPRTVGILEFLPDLVEGIGGWETPFDLKILSLWSRRVRASSRIEGPSGGTLAKR